MLYICQFDRKSTSRDIGCQVFGFFFGTHTGDGGIAGRNDGFDIGDADAGVIQQDGDLLVQVFFRTGCKQLGPVGVKFQFYVRFDRTGRGNLSLLVSSGRYIFTGYDFFGQSLIDGVLQKLRELGDRVSRVTLEVLSGV